MDRCRAHAVSFDADREWVTFDAPRAVGLVKVSAGSLWEGPLTAWPPEAHALRRYYQYPDDAYIARVQEVFRFDEPVHISKMWTKDGYEARLRLPAAGGFPHLVVRAEGEGVLAGVRCTVQEVCTRWGYSGDLASLRATVQVAPIAQLILNLQWVNWART